ncbi:MAG TPA: molybdopterin molybdotransferase MoeA, partial [Ilumatobacteraceae bacterium]
MTPLEDAQALVIGACPPLPPVEVQLRDASNRVLAADVVATEAVPPFANSAVDGYAVRAADVASVPVELTVVDEVAAGRASSVRLGVGEAIRIMTGAPIPDGADAVVMVEDTERVGDHSVRLLASVPAGAALRAAGDDVQPGDVLFRAGTVIRPAVHGVLASTNARRVMVHPAARVAVLSTGDELVSDGAPLAPGQIRESNLGMLAGLLREVGCEVTDLGVVRDDEAELERVLRDAAATH